jgi:hypothetical protein
MLLVVFIFCVLAVIIVIPLLIFSSKKNKTKMEVSGGGDCPDTASGHLPLACHFNGDDKCGKSCRRVQPGGENMDCGGSPSCSDCICSEGPFPVVCSCGH